MRVLRFDVFTLDLPRRLLLRAGNEVPLRPQVFDVLQYLAEHQGQVVSKRELFDTVWGGAARTDDSVVQCIMDIREALGDADHRIVKTVPRRGYLFTSEVSQAPSGEPASPVPASPPRRAGFEARPTRLEPEPAPPLQWQRALIAAGLLITVLAGSGWLLWDRLRPQPPVVLTMMAVPSIAVLPFKTVGEERDQADVAGALTGHIETALSRTPRGYNMRIRSAPGYKGPVEHPRGTGRELGVRYLVLGSIRREGDVRQVNVQLIEAENGRPVWAEPFKYAPAEPEAQNRMAAQIARTLHGQVLRAESRLPLPAHPEAGHFVILGRAILAGERGVEGWRQAKALFDKARALDPNSVPALLGYGRTRVSIVLNRWVPKEQWKALLDEAGAAIAHAIELDSRDAGVHVLHGAWFRAWGRDAEAITAFERALDLYANHPLAHAELGRAKIDVGRADETVAHIEEAIRLSPTDPYQHAWYFWAGMAEAHVGRYDKALYWLRKARQASPAYINTIGWLAVVFAGLDRMEEARAHFAEHRANFPNFSLSGWRLAFPHSNQTVAAQRERIEALLCRIGAPGCDVATGATR